MSTELARVTPQVTLIDIPSASTAAPPVVTPGSGYPSADEVARMKAEHRIAWHVKGGWCRKFPGDANRTYFGKVSAPAAVKAMHAEEEKRRRGEQTAGRGPGALQVKDAANAFLNHLDEELAKGEITAVTRARYGDAVDLFITIVGRTRRLADLCRTDAPETIFKPIRQAAVARGLFAAEKIISQIRTFLNWSSTIRRLMPAPFYADAFNAPSAKEKNTKVKAERREKGTARWTVAEVREIVEAAKSDVHRYAQVLLMLNGGMGATDLSNLDDAEVKWDIKCIDTDRSKTLVPRIVPLWDITANAMKASRDQRADPEKPEHASRFFLTMHGRPLVIEKLLPDEPDAKKKRAKASRVDVLANWFYRMVNKPQRKEWKEKAVRLPHLKRHKAGLYTLRATFANLAMGHGQDRNLDAIILGHEFDRKILEHYLRGDNREKLFAVVEHVRKQIWPAD